MLSPFEIVFFSFDFLILFFNLVVKTAVKYHYNNNDNRFIPTRHQLKKNCINDDDDDKAAKKEQTKGTEILWSNCRLNNERNHLIVDIFDHW